MSIWLKNLVGIIFILHGMVYGLMLIPFPDMPGTGIGKYWSGLVSSKLLSYLNVSEYRIKLIAITISLIAMAGFIMAGASILTTGVPNKLFLVTTIASSGISVIFLMLFWHNYNIVGFIINIAALILSPFLYARF